MKASSEFQIGSPEEREQINRHREMIYQAEAARLQGVPTYSSAEICRELHTLYEDFKNDF